MTAPGTASIFAAFRFPPEVTSVAIRWHLRYGLSYRDVEELLAGNWTYLYRAVDQHGQVIDVLLSTRRDLTAARRFFDRALRAGTVPVKVTTDRAPVYPRMLDELVPSALHTAGQHANNPIEADHGRLKPRLRPMRGLKRHRCARILAAGHAFVQNLRRGHYDIATEAPDRHGSAWPSTTSHSPSEPAQHPDHAGRWAGCHNATAPSRVVRDQVMVNGGRSPTMTQMTPEELDNQADARELINSEITSLARQAGSGQRLDTKAVLLVRYAGAAASFLATRHVQPILAALAYAAYGLCVTTGIIYLVH